MPFLHNLQSESSENTFSMIILKAFEFKKLKKDQ